MYRLIGKIRPISLYTSKTPGESGSPRQSGSRVTGVPGRVGSRVSVTDPVPTLPRIHSWESNFCIIRLLYRFVCLFVCFWLMLKCKDTGCCGGADICQEGRPDTRYRTWNAPRQFVIPHRDSATSWCTNLRSPSICVCAENVEQYGVHGLSCRRSAGRHSRNSAVNNVAE